MIKRNENRPGYKKSPIGWIPDEWDSTRLGKHVKIVSGHSPSVYLPVKNGTYPFVKVDDLNSSDVFQHTARLYSDIGISVVPQNAIIFAKRGAAISTNKIRIASRPLVMDSNMMALVSMPTIHFTFLYYFILKEKLWKIADTSSIPQINNKHINPYKIAFPPLFEQIIITKILTIWDKAIEKIKNLITANIKLKKGLMQQLLTGRYRFLKFGPPLKNKIELPKGWTKYKLGDCFKDRLETDSDLTLLSITSDRGIIPRNEVERKDSSNFDKSKYKKIVPGDIGYNTMRMWQGVSAVSTVEGIVSPAYTICAPKNGMVSKYFGYLFKYSPIIHKFHRYSQGLVNDTLNLKFHNFAQIKINIPNEKEQKCIAEILSAIDIEIGLLEKELSILLKQKKGLMQKLLTGEVRVKIKKGVNRE